MRRLLEDWPAYERHSPELQVEALYELGYLKRQLRTPVTPEAMERAVRKAKRYMTRPGADRA